jgi:hypothetical protein
MKQAQDTFVADMPDGTVTRVERGEILPDNHVLVQRDKTGTLFKTVTLGDDVEKARPARGVAKAAK